MGLLAIPFADLERMLAEDWGTETVTVAARYPERRTSTKVDAKVVWVLEVDALVNVYGDKKSRRSACRTRAFGLARVA